MTAVRWLAAIAHRVAVAVTGGGLPVPVVGWCRSSRCESTHCVEVRRTADTVWVRDSVDPDGPQLRFDAEVWRHFVAGLCRG